MKTKYHCQSFLRFIFSFLFITVILVSTSYSQVEINPTVNAEIRDKKILELWNQIQRAEKGPFGINEYQTRDTRFPVGTRNESGGFTIHQPPAGNLITVAFRTNAAETLARDFQLYVGNRYTINYHFIHGKAIPGSTDNKKFLWSHQQLLQNSALAKTAFEIAKQMTIEQFHIRENSESKISKTYNRRGSAEAEHEAKYFQLFMEYLIQHLSDDINTSDSNFLVMYELARRTYVGEGGASSGGEISLPYLRSKVANIYERVFHENNNTRNKITIEFYSIRNSIHNGMTPAVIRQINSFLSQNSQQISSETMKTIEQLQNEIIAYYEVKIDILKNRAKKISSLPEETNTILENISDENPTLESLENLAKLLGKMKQQIFEHKEGVQKLLFIIKGIEYTEAKLTKIPLTEQNFYKKINILLELSKIQGIARNDIKNDQINSAIINAISKIQFVYKDALSDWLKLDKKIDLFIDDIMRSSSFSQIDYEIKQYKTISVKKAPLAENNNSISSSIMPKMEIMRAGISYGYLIYISADDLASQSNKYKSLNSQSIAIFQTLPLDLTVVSATITEEEQTPLCHINIKSTQRGTPNLYLEKANQNSKLLPFLDKNILVRLEVNNSGFNVREASNDEAQKYWQQNRPKAVGKLEANLSERKIQPTTNLNFLSYTSVGSKAANYAELQKVMPNIVQEGFAIPFSHYVDFIKMNGFDRDIDQMLENPKFKEDHEYRILALKDLQTKMRSDDSQVNDELIEEIRNKINSIMGNRKVRFRSSTNSEDLENFSGAGLYDSDGYDPMNKQEKLLSEKKQRNKIRESLKKVWSSLWNLRAFDERELFGIEHASVYAAILVSPAYSFEEANGVILSRNIENNGPVNAVYINSQVGEVSVTNPPNAQTPDIITVIYNPSKPLDLSSYKTVVKKISSITQTQPTLSKAEINNLAFYTMKSHLHFQKLYANHKRKGIIDPSFTVDIEFKIHPNPFDPINKPREIYFKQIRPYVYK